MISGNSKTLSFILVTRTRPSKRITTRHCGNGIGHNVVDIGSLRHSVVDIGSLRSFPVLTSMEKKPNGSRYSVTFTDTSSMTDASSRVGSEILARIEKLETTILEAVKISRPPSLNALCAAGVPKLLRPTRPIADADKSDADKSDPKHPGMTQEGKSKKKKKVLLEAMTGNDDSMSLHARVHHRPSHQISRFLRPTRPMPTTPANLGRSRSARARKMSRASEKTRDVPLNIYIIGF